MTELFTPSWIEQWFHSIQTSDAYKKEAKDWNQSVLLKFHPVPTILLQHNALGFFLDLRYGECHELRYATESDLDTADIILEASEADWRQLLEHGGDPLFFIMKKRIRLIRGGLVYLSTQRKAASALLATATVSGTADEARSAAPSLSDLWSAVKSTVASGSSANSTASQNSNGARTVSHQPESRTGFVTTGRGLDRQSVPMALFQKSKTLGIWNPAEIDLKKDREQWEDFSKEEKGLLHHLSAMFMAGEEAVTLDLLPLIRTVAAEGRIEEEIYLTSFLWEEAKHTEFFDLYMKEVMGSPQNLESYHGPMYRILFYEKLPNALNALWTDSSPAAQLKASATYNMIVEGTLAETGYEAYFNMLEERDLLPGLREGITYLKRDESRHIAFALHFLGRLLAEHPSLTGYLEEELGILLGDATNIVHEIFDRYRDEVPFGLDREWFLNYAVKQFQNRIQKLGLG